jgi:hypothetical protein
LYRTEWLSPTAPRGSSSTSAREQIRTHFDQKKHVGTGRPPLVPGNITKLSQVWSNIVQLDVPLIITIIIIIIVIVITIIIIIIVIIVVIIVIILIVVIIVVLILIIIVIFIIIIVVVVDRAGN